jgi:hypothetical protein
VTGAAPARVELVVDRCAPDKSARRQAWVVRNDADWPATLTRMCEFASAAATGELTAQAKSSCGRAGGIRPESLLALARYGGPKENRAWKALEAIMAADPQFAPAAVEYLTWVSNSGDRDEFWNRVVAVAWPPQSSAAQLIGFSPRSALRMENPNQPSQVLRLGARPSPSVRSRSSSGKPRGRHADRLAEGKDEPTLTIGPFPWRKEPYTPNEATHTAALALSLGVYGNWPRNYRSQWLLGYALMRYGWMLRGTSMWADVPESGKEGFPVFIKWADRFNDAALRAHPEADSILVNKMNTTKLRDGDWLAVFDRAVEVNPHHQRLYEDAINFSLRQWGGTAETRDRVFDLALSNNPDAEWAKTLREQCGNYGQPDL